MKKINKPAGFWIRILSIIIDLIIFATSSISISLIAINGKEIIPWAYYVWMVLTIILILILFIFIPILFKGKTIGMLCCQINIISTDSDSKSIWLMVLRKNKLYSFLWIFSILVSMSFITPQLAQRIIENNNNNNLEPWEQALLSIPSTTSGIIIFINIFMTLSINASKNKEGFNDKFSSTKVIYSKKYIDVFDEKNKVIVREQNKIINIIWKE